MAKEPQKTPPKSVRYRVKLKCQVNNTLYDPDDPKHGGQPLYVVARAGLEGPALDLAPEGSPVPEPGPGPAVGGLSIPDTDGGSGDPGAA